MEIMETIAAAACTLAIPASHLFQLSNIQFASIRYGGGPTRWATMVLGTLDA